MRFLANESCDMAVVQALREKGHCARRNIGNAAVSAIDAMGEKLESAFVVVEPGRFRVTDPKP